MSLRPKKGRVSLSILGVYTHNNARGAGVEIPSPWQRSDGPWSPKGLKDAAAAAATNLNIYGSNLVIIIPYIVMYVATAVATFMEKHLYNARSQGKARQC